MATEGYACGAQPEKLPPGGQENADGNQNQIFILFVIYSVELCVLCGSSLFGSGSVEKQAATVS